MTPLLQSVFLRWSHAALDLETNWEHKEREISGGGGEKMHEKKQNIYSAVILCSFFFLFIDIVKMIQYNRDH